MGARLGADFSSVNMHTDADSVSKADHMGARAMAQGNDIYFCRADLTRRSLPMSWYIPFSRAQYRGL